MSNNTIAQYAIYVRDNNRNLVGQVDEFNQFEYVGRFNAVGNWSLDVDADTPMAGYLATRGYGLVVNRAIVDAVTGVVTQSNVLMSGPIRGWSRQMQGNKLVVSGLDDLCWLAMRDAWPVSGAANYGTTVLALPGIARYYKLGESSGTAATDSKSAVNGTYAGGFTLGQAAIVDDPATSVLLNGTTGNVSAAGTSLPTGNSAMYIGAWIELSALPASSGTAFWYGNSTEGTRTGLYAFVNADGTVQAKSESTSSATPVSTVAVTVNAPHLLGAMWDGTNMTCWLDGVVVGSIGLGAFSLGNSAFNIGKKISTSFFPGQIGHVFAGAGALTAAQWQNVYDIGISRFGTGAYDTQSGVAETVIRHYVDVNGVSATTSDLKSLSRVVSGLSLAANGGHGSAVTGNARFTPQVTKDGTGLLQQLALASSPALGFTVTQSGTSLVFSVYVPNDKTGSIIFSEELGNLADFTYEVQAPDIDSGGNVTIVGGGGEGVARVIVERADTTSVTNWGRAEMFSDARDTSDILTLQQRGDTDLAQAAETISFSAVLAPTESMVYGRDFGLGDTVTVVVDGVAFQDIVREVDISLTTDGAETVTPAVGTPVNASPKDALAKLAARLRATQAQLARLQRAQ